MIPAPLVVVVLGVALAALFERFGGAWPIGESHLVQVPVAGDLRELVGFLRRPDIARWADPAILAAAPFLVYDSVWVAIGVAALLCLMPVITAIDIERRIIPNKLMYPALIVAPVYLVVASLAGAPPSVSLIVSPAWLTRTASMSWIRERW